MTNRTVLIVDDEMNIRLFLRALVESAGCAAALAKNGRDGLVLARKHRPDVIILDVMMPGKGGLIMYRELKRDEELKNTPVIMLSAVEAPTFGHALKMIGMAEEPLPEPEAYVEKPPAPAELLETIDNVLRRAA